MEPYYCIRLLCGSVEATVKKNLGTGPPVCIEGKLRERGEVGAKKATLKPYFWDRAWQYNCTCAHTFTFIHTYMFEAQRSTPSLVGRAVIADRSCQIWAGGTPSASVNVAPAWETLGWPCKWRWGVEGWREEPWCLKSSGGWWWWCWGCFWIRTTAPAPYA